MTKENSPIWVRLMPACTAVRTGWPERNDPTVTPTDLPTSTTEVERQDEGPVAQRARGVEEHADRHEEDAGEHVAQRLDQRLDMARHAGLGDEGAGEEGAERHREPLRLGKEGEGEAEPDTGDEQGLLATERHDESGRRAARPAVRTPSSAATTSTRRPAVAIRMFPVSPVPASEGRDRGQHEDGHQVLGDQDAEDGLAGALLEAEVLESVRHDHGGRDRHQRTGEQAGAGIEAEQRCDLGARARR